MTVKDQTATNKRSAQSTEEENLLIFCKQMLKTRVFRGNYQERRYVDSVKGYRDLVVLANHETELKGDLKYIRSRIVNFYKDPYLWIGITLPETIGTPAGICIWTEVQDTAFGDYWFQIKSIRFLVNEVIIKMKPLQKITMSSNMNPDMDSQSQDNDSSDEGITTEKILNLLQMWKQAISSSVMTFLTTEISKENIVAAIRFTLLFLLSVGTGLLELLKHLGEFSIRFFTEMRMLLIVGTPILLKILDLFGKFVGGVFILLAMIWRDIFGIFRRPAENNYPFTKQLLLPPPPQQRYQAARSDGREFYRQVR